MTLKYLYDENISKSDKFLKEHPEAENAKYKIGKSADDIRDIQGECIVNLFFREN